MTLTELAEKILPQFPAYGRKDLKTALKVLAVSAAYPDVAHCPSTILDRPLPTLYRQVETYLVGQGKKAATIRNTKNNLSRLARLAATEGLLSEPATCDRLHRPYTYADWEQRRRRGFERNRHDQSWLTLPYWSKPLRVEYEKFTHWATAPVVPGRPARWRKREITLANYRTAMESYFGYLFHQRKLRRLKFDHLFDIDLVRDYIHWHINERHGEPTNFIKKYIQFTAALTNQYRPLPAFRAQLKAIDREIPWPPAYFDKSEAWVPMATLGAIGRSLWPTTPFAKLTGDGSLSARNAGLSVLFQLWTFIPYRSRNVREMRLEHNLRRVGDHQWRIIFTGEEMKVARKRGKPNDYNLPVPAELTPALEAYLSDWRPILAAKCQYRHPEVFLTMMGLPYRREGLNETARKVIFYHTGQYWHPHIVRTVWATEWIRDKHPGDFYDAAVMLNDTLQTVINRYSHLLGDGVAERVYDRISQGARP